MKLKRFAIIKLLKKDKLYPNSQIAGGPCDNCGKPIVRTYLYDMFTGRRFHDPQCRPKRIGWGRDGRGLKVDARRKY